jgi:hypothetical protein
VLFEHLAPVSSQCTAYAEGQTSTGGIQIRPESPTTLYPKQNKTNASDFDTWKHGIAKDEAWESLIAEIVWTGASKMLWNTEALQSYI